MGLRTALGVARLFVIATLVGRTVAASDATQPPVALAPSPVRHGSVFVDPLGFLLFGPRLGVELGAGRVSGTLYGRWFSSGVLAHTLFLGSGDEFGFSYGVGAAGRYYFAEGLERLHLGLAVEYLSTSIETPSVLIVSKSAYFVPQLEAGYRLPIGAFYADASAALGYAFRLSGKIENLPGGSDASSYVAKDKSSFYGSASLDLGVYF